VLISTDSSHEGQRLGLNDYFVQGFKGKYLQEPSYSLSLGKMTIVASAPVLDGSGKTIGVIAGRADLSGLSEIMIERAGLGDTGETYLVGSNYRLLTYLRLPGYSIPDTYIRTEGTDVAIGLGQDGSNTYEGYAGDSVIGVYDWIPGLRVALVAEQEEAEALGPTRVALFIIAGVALLAAALAILAGIALTRRIVRPLAQLGSTAGRIAAGELDLEADVGQHDEIGTLAEAFNRMTAGLRELAAARERQRLARDLHDAVSQTLFSVSLIAEVLPRIYERNPEEGQRQLEELRVLTRGALAEMRTLLLELRPAALADAQLPDLLRQLSEAVVGRARIPVEVETDEGCSAIPSEVRVALYYIAHEALNNVAKHSGATKARVELTCQDTGVRLSIEDDGRGFDPASSGQGQLGLGIMRERAESFGGTLEVRTAPAQGTRIIVTWSPAATGD
jgi:signal transduction histidine kinase